MSTQIERRVMSSTGAQLRAATKDKEKVLEGYSATFDTLSANLAPKGSRAWYERLNKSAFEKTLTRGDKVNFNFQHDEFAVPLGTTKSGTLSLRTDNKGLFFRCVLPDTEAARSLHTAVMRGDLSDCSFSFTDPLCDWNEEVYDGEDDDTRGLKRGSRIAVRDVRSLVLRDCSVVVSPAYPTGTSVAARAQNIVLATPPDIATEAAKAAEAAERIETIRARRRSLIFGGW